MWHNKDYVTLKAGTIILVITTCRNPDGIFEVLSEEKIHVTGTLKIRNEERTEETPEDRNIRVYALAYL